MRSVTKKEYPWITYGAIRWHDKYLGPEHKVFEFGPGDSSIYFAKKASSIFSIEHDSDYFKEVSQKLSSFNNSTIILVPPELGGESDFHYRSKTLKKYHDLNFKNYCSSISFFPDQYFDLILIDGRCRESCLQLSASKVKKDGFIILDNSERESY